MEGSRVYAGEVAKRTHWIDPMHATVLMVHGLACSSLGPTHFSMPCGPYFSFALGVFAKRINTLREGRRVQDEAWDV